MTRMTANVKFKTDKLAILLATYNGIQFLPDLIDSLQKQSYTDWLLYVQDDLSNDGTLEFLREKSLSDVKIVLVPNNKKLGAKLNFLTLLNVVEAPYYMFCDQDDIWLPHKVQVAFDRIKVMEQEHGANSPLLVHSDLTVVDENLNIIDESFMKMSRINPNLLKTFHELAGHNLVTGCTMMFNRSAAEVSSRCINNSILMHDVWILLCTLKFNGFVEYINKSTILYRQHGSNTVGAHDIRSNYILKRLFALKSVLTGNVKHYKMLNTLGYGSILRYSYYKIRYFVLNSIHL